jgi:hypothetical protein
MKLSIILPFLVSSPAGRGRGRRLREMSFIPSFHCIFQLLRVSLRFSCRELPD